MLYLNFRIALWNILKNPGFSLINIGGLAIGLACCLNQMPFSLPKAQQKNYSVMKTLLDKASNGIT
ncbi:hypothetical protein SAMN05443550_109123 [Pedobacter hartonius]|uniref:Uncharacterized protein n=1 Tax=Pedobacter hartonius TaxID=425514 RepID=A0A1H4G962_9SPHI|nr:hypothetical protein SAMN05443550_109123 [Pedobacter hartonius]